MGSYICLVTHNIEWQTVYPDLMLLEAHQACSYLCAPQNSIQACAATCSLQDVGMQPPSCITRISSDMLSNVCVCQQTVRTSHDHNDKADLALSSRTRQAAPAKGTPSMQQSQPDCTTGQAQNAEDDKAPVDISCSILHPKTQPQVINCKSEHIASATILRW